MNRKGQELKTNVTDPQSAKLATSKGVIQGYAAQAAVDSVHKIIIAADVIGSGSEQTMLLPMIEQATPYQAYTAQAADCQTCALRAQGLKGPLKPNYGRGRQVSRFEPKPKDPANPSERMRQAIDSPRGRQLYSQRFGTVEPVFGNIRHNK